MTNNLDSNNVDSNNLDSNNLDSNNLDSNNLDSNNLDSNNLDSNNLDSNKFNINIHSNIHESSNLISKINNSPNKDTFISLQELYNKNNQQQYLNSNMSDKSNSINSINKQQQFNKRKETIEELNKIEYIDDQYSECCEVSTCCKKLLEFEVDAQALIKMMPVCDYRKQILLRRYANDIADYERKKDCIRFVFRLFQMIVTIGSILVPSLLSIQMTEHVKTNYEVEINLGVWVISIIVSICNGVINLFKMDELYYNLGITLEKLKTIWYQYVSLSGPFTNTTHNESYHIFIDMMEEIIMTQKFQEYIDSKSDKNKPREVQEDFGSNMNMYNKLINNDIENNNENNNLQI